MKKSMKHKKYPKFEDYDFSDCREITGDELYRINGGGRIENSNEAVAGAEVGDTLIRDDGTEVTLTQEDIDWARGHTSGGNDSPQAAPEPVNTTPTNQTPSYQSPSNQSNSSDTSSQTSNPSYGTSESLSTSSSNQTEIHTTNDQYIMAQRDLEAHNERMASAAMNNNTSGNLTDRGYPSSRDENYGINKSSKTDINSNNEINETLETNENYLFNIRPAQGKITSEYGYRGSFTVNSGEQTKDFHAGLDIANIKGTPIISVSDGKVLENAVSKPYGNYIVVAYPETKGWNADVLLYYCHLDEKSDKEVGSIVSAGEQIGLMGETGYATGPHLHIETRTDFGATKHNPRDYINFGD
ncbi:MAG: M23 family metallopeptidase [Treponema sp.]|nr:M23 family metallopeptidase [Treponema sp.]